MDKTMTQASEEAEAQTDITEGEEVIESQTEEVQTETSEQTQQDQVTTGAEETPSEGESEVTPATTTEDFDPIAFVDSLELESLTPEHKQALKDGYLRQSDYTKKTQALAEDRKTIDEYRTLKPFIDKIFQDENLYSQVFGNGQTDAKATDLVNEIPDDPQEYANWVEQRAVEKAVKIIEEQNRQAEFERTLEADRNAASQLDPRLNTDPEFAEEIGGILAMDQEFLSGQITAVEATQKALGVYRTREARYRAKVTQDLQNKAKAKTMVMPQQRSSGVTSSGNTQRPSSMAEAARMAEEQLN
jgi:hypothetical protein